MMGAAKYWTYVVLHVPLGTIPALLGFALLVVAVVVWRSENRFSLARGIQFVAVSVGAFVLIAFGVAVLILAGNGCC